MSIPVSIGLRAGTNQWDTRPSPVLGQTRSAPLTSIVKRREVLVDK